MKIENVNKFIEDLKVKCEKHNVGLFLYDSKHIYHEGDKYGGWFDPEKQELHCSFPKKIQSKFVELLIHESCHLDQWINKTPAWEKERIENSLDVFWEWTKGKKATRVTDHVRNIQRMEAECERMSVQKMIDLDLGINVKKYIQKANSYLLFYTVMKITKKWVDTPPYRSREIYSQMESEKIITDFKMSQELIDLYIKKCYKKTPLI